MRIAHRGAAGAGIVLVALGVGVARADLTVGAWEPRAPMNGVTSHTAAFLHAGRILVLDSWAGGVSPMKAYDVASDTWTSTTEWGETYESMPAGPRSEYAAAMLGDSIYVAGGWTHSDCHT